MKYSLFKRLSNQAAASVTSGLRGCDWQREYDKIFAELIVRECAKVADIADENKCEWIGGNILTHFGVEE
jgi:hypothetical protein